MVQLIITVIIVAAAAGITLYRMIAFFRKEKKAAGCSAGCNGCTLAEKIPHLHAPGKGR